MNSVAVVFVVLGVVVVVAVVDTRCGTNGLQERRTAKRMSSKYWREEEGEAQRFGKGCHGLLIL